MAMIIIKVQAILYGMKLYYIKFTSKIVAKNP